MSATGARRWSRRALAAALAAATLVATVLLVLALPTMQRALWRLMTTSLTAGTPWSVEAGRVRLHLLGGRLEVGDLAISRRGATVLAADRVEAVWRWAAVVAAPRRIDRLVARGVELDLRHLPGGVADARRAPRPPGLLPGLEIADAEIGLEVLRWALPGIDVLEVGSATLRGSLRAGRVEGVARAAAVEALRDGRSLTLSGLTFDAVVDRRSVAVADLATDRGPVELAGSADVRLAPRPAVSSDLVVAGDLDRISRWWSPGLAERLEPRGRLELRGALSWSAAGLAGGMRHVGDELGVAGYPIASLRLEGVDGRPRLAASHPRWGFVEAELRADRRLAVRALLEDAAAGPALRHAPDEVAARLPAGIAVSGRADVVLAPLPEFLLPGSVDGDADLQASWPEGELSVALGATDDGVRFRELQLALPGGRLSASGRATLDGQVSADLDGTIGSPGAFLAALGPWLPGALSGLRPAGGPLQLHASLEGPARGPALDARLTWQDPAYGPVEGRSLQLRARGHPDDLRWQLALEASTGVRLEARGRADLGAPAVQGAWTLSAGGGPPAAPLAAGAGLEVTASDLRGRGRLTWRGDLHRATAAVTAEKLGFGRWRVEDLVLDAVLADSRLEIQRLAARGLGGDLDAVASVPVAGDGELEATLEITGLDLASLPAELPAAFHGTVSSRLEVTGTARRPEVDVALGYRPASSGSLPALKAAGRIDGGRLTLELEPAEVAGATVHARAELPLGDLPRPPGVLADAPVGPLHLSVTSDRRRLGPLLDLLAAGPLPLEASAEVELDATWPLLGDGPRRAELRLRGLEASSAQETLRAAAPVRLEVDDGVAVLHPFRLEGEVSSATVSARLDLAERSVVAEAGVVVGPSWLRLLPFDLDATGRLEVALRLEGPLDDLDGTVTVAQPSGEIVLRDPPVEVTGLTLRVRYADGVWSVPDGSAAVNGGSLLIGGEWNTDSGQGVIFGFEDVAFLLPESILSRWDGSVVVEPAPGRSARVVGELTLMSGLWDHPVDLTGVLFGRDLEPGAANELLLDVPLDLEVYGRGPVAVENNLGDFDVTWLVLDLSGTLADPRIAGEMLLVPGGVITLAGRPVEIARGSVRFSGAPGVSPEIEVVPVRDAAAGAGTGFDAQALLRRGVASRVGSFLGLTNERLEPASIAVETLASPSTNYLVSRQIGRYIALFLAADLADVQQRSMLLQLYNWRAVPGLALQAIEDTRSGSGFAAIERYRWGGTVDERPHLRRVRLEGDWPLPERRLRRALGLERGQPYDPFLVFVGRVRLERELARAGYFRPRVHSEVSEDPRLPGLAFTAEPGPRQEVVFRGDELPQEVRRDTVSRYRPPPLEEEGFDAMGRRVREHLDAVGHPFGDLEVRREGNRVVVEVDLGEEVHLAGPTAAGLDDETLGTLKRVVGGPADLAPLARRQPEALRLVERLLRLEGYLEPRVREVRLVRPPDGDATVVELEVEHGGQATIGEVSVDGAESLAAGDLDDLPVARGAALRRSRIEAAERQLRDALRERGHLDAEVHSAVEGDGLTRTVRLTVDPGPRYRIAGIRVRGLRHLRESVVRRGLEVSEGDVARPRALNESLSELAGFGPIARVDLESRDVGPGRVDYEIDVTEKARWTVGAGARWSQDTGLLGLVDLRDDGLLGRGFSLDLRGLMGSGRTALGLVASLPRRPGGRWSTSLTLSYRDLPSRTEPDLVQEQGYGATLEATLHLGSGVSLRGYYLFDETLSSSLLIGSRPPVERTVRQSTVGWQGILDRLDDPLDPTAGWYLAADVGWSTPALGGGVHALRTLLTATRATSPLDGWVWLQTARLGWARALDGGPLEEQVRFFAGGPASIRGFEQDLVGPVLRRPDGSLRPLGGGALAVLNEELRIPVYTHGAWGSFGLAVFADLGQVWPSVAEADLALAVGAGLGLRWSGPVGPVWADLAWPVAGVQGKRGPKLSIGLGRPF